MSPSASSPDADADAARSVLVLYATETGTALDAARQIAHRLSLIHFRTRILSADAYPLPNLVCEPLVLFVVSTTGSGAFPRSLLPLWDVLLRADLPGDLLDETAYAVFGLGDTAYEKFCWAAKKLDRRLQSLGARPVMERGEGDEQHRLGIDGALEPWMDSLSQTLLALYPLPDDLTPLSKDALPLPSVSITDDRTPGPSSPAPPKSAHPGTSYHPATVRTNRRITADGWFQDVRHFEFDFEDDIVYSPGDVAVIHPLAPTDAVGATLEALGLTNSADDSIYVSPTSPSNDLSLPVSDPTRTTLRTLLTHTLDVSAVPRRSFFALMRHFATDETEREKLDEWLNGDEEGAEDLYEYTTRVRRTIAEVLADFRYTAPLVPREYLFDLLPPLRAREFSIACSVKTHPRQVQLCVAIVQYRTRLKIPRRGVCTAYMAALQPGQKITIGLRKGLITLPNSPSTPVICIGPGTGIAPMRAVIQERIHDGAHDSMLYFGCRSETQDQHYASEWAALSSSSSSPSSATNHTPAPRLKYRLAPSRSGPEGTPRTYVQHLLSSPTDRPLVWDIIGKRGGYVYISGSSNQMPKAVRKALVDVAVSEGGMNAGEDVAETGGEGREGEAERWVAMLEREGRLVEECWS